MEKKIINTRVLILWTEHKYIHTITVMFLFKRYLENDVWKSEWKSKTSLMCNAVALKKTVSDLGGDIFDGPRSVWDEDG